MVKKRNTAAKQKIRDMLVQSPTALSQDMLEKELKEEVDRVTIYRVLNSFVEDGLVHKIVSDEGKAYYAVCHGCDASDHRHEHAHFRCLNCGKVECLPGIVQVDLPQGYTINSLNYWISGYCPACQDAAKEGIGQ